MGDFGRAVDHAQRRRVRDAGSVTVLALLALTGCALDQSNVEAGREAGEPLQVASDRLSALCTPESAQAVAATLVTTKVSVGKIPDGPFGVATKFVAANGTMPAYCQITGSFVTNQHSGKTANFLATLPANWNGKYLQIGCSGHCGQFYVSNPATPSIVVTTQGDPNQIIEKGYATFATDEGHSGMAPASWALNKDGSLDRDALDDFLYRADLVLADMGKEFTKAFYQDARGIAHNVTRAYFAGCSGGGRDALVATSYFPEKFDGIIAGSPYDPVGMGAHSFGAERAMAQSPAFALTPALFDLFDHTVKDQCDAMDGVKDGTIQNPLACNFRPDRDLPRCAPGTSGSQCFTDEQIKSVSTLVTAMTDEHGRVFQPGFTVSELQAGAGIGYLGDGVIKVFVHENDAAFSSPSIFTFGSGGPGPVDGYRVKITAEEYARIRSALAQGAGHLPENMGKLRSSRTKLLIWHNFSDERLSPISSVNYYNRLAKSFGGISNVQKQARLFLLPGTAHCSITGIGPNQFDALSAMEDWVERNKAPDELELRVANHQFTPGAKPAPALQYPNWTARVCKFPEM